MNPHPWRHRAAGCLGAVAFWIRAAAAVAHGDLNEQIAEVTMQILEHHDEAGLYLKRAELHRVHEDWPAAAADYDRAEKLAPGWHVVHFARGKMLLASGRLEEAKRELDRFLAAQPTHVEALVTRGRVQRQRGYALAATEDFASAITHSPRPEPDVYLERAQTLAAAGEEHLPDAVRCLDEGRAKLGNLPTLELCAVELEVKQKHFDAALTRLDRISAMSPRKESWIERRGDILAVAGRAGEARQAYRAALDAAAKLPSHLRATRAVEDLNARVARKLGNEDQTELHRASVQPLEVR